MFYKISFKSITGDNMIERGPKMQTPSAMYNPSNYHCMAAQKSFLDLYHILLLKLINDH